MWRGGRGMEGVVTAKTPLSYLRLHPDARPLRLQAISASRKGFLDRILTLASPSADKFLGTNPAPEGNSKPRRSLALLVFERERTINVSI